MKAPGRPSYGIETQHCLIKEPVCQPIELLIAILAERGRCDSQNKNNARSFHRPIIALQGRPEAEQWFEICDFRCGGHRQPQSSCLTMGINGSHLDITSPLLGHQAKP
jgi:hypothetical protein